MSGPNQQGAGNASLHAAREAKNDEFYTQLSDIENELYHYTDHFRGKTVYCNCDDPRDSQFFHYFSYYFELLGLRRLIASCYKNQSPDLFSRHDSEKAIWLEYEGDRNRNCKPDAHEIDDHKFRGNGDFRSDESIKLLKQADIVVTNPPFSLFREYVAQLMEYKKKFLIVGNMNAVTYKEIFPLLMNDQVWLGITPKGHDMLFGIPNDYAKNLLADERAKEGSAYRIVDGVVKGRLGNAAWFTNLEHDNRHKELILWKRYSESPDEYPRYDNYNAINVDEVAKIPEDYPDAMGVPITFLDKYNPNQFEIVGLDRYAKGNATPGKRFMLKGKEIYARILIRNRRPQS